MSVSTSTRVGKRIHIPEPGDYFTDNVRLVEVVAPCPEGWRVRDVTKTLRGRTETLPTGALLKWRHVEPSEDAAP